MISSSLRTPVIEALGREVEISQFLRMRKEKVVERRHIYILAVKISRSFTGNRGRQSIWRCQNFDRSLIKPPSVHGQ